MTDTKKPRTAEEWAKRIYKSYFSTSSDIESHYCEDIAEAIHSVQEQARREAIKECANIAKRYAEEDCDDADEFTMAANDIEEEIRGLLEKK